MPSQLDDNEIEDLEPSTDPALDEQPAAPDKGEQADDATSSTATGETDDSLLSVVRDVVTEGRQDQTASPAEGDEDGQSTGEQPPKEQDNENYSDVPFHKHPRFQQLLRQRNSYQQDAERYQNVQNFLDGAGLTAEEAADGLTVMALMKTNPVEAWKRLKPTVQKLLVAAGEVLPEDLQQMVREGKMDQAAALEVSRSRAGVQSMQVRQTFEEQQRQRMSQRQAVQALGGAAQDWETARRQKDPNFDAKLADIQKEVLYLQHTEGRPNTPDGVKAQLEKAYKNVNDRLKPANPAPQRQRPALKPITGGQVAGNQRPAEQSTLDIVRANRRAG